MMKCIRFVIIYFLCFSSVVVAQTEISVLNYNILGSTVFNSLSWSDRKQKVFVNIDKHSPDIIALQEVVDRQQQHDDLVNNYSNTYHVIGEFDYMAGTISPAGTLQPRVKNMILVKKSTFNVILADTFWFTDTPNIQPSQYMSPTQQWQGEQYLRFASWALLKVSDTNEYLFIVNTHLSHNNHEFNNRAVQFLAEKMWGLKFSLWDPMGLIKHAPILTTGDFNSTSASNAVQYLLNTKNSLSTTISHDGMSFTYPNNFQKSYDSFCLTTSLYKPEHCDTYTTLNNKIDYILATHEVCPIQNDVYGLNPIPSNTYTPIAGKLCRGIRNGVEINICPSDHAALFSKFKMLEVRQNFINYEDYLIPFRNCN